MAGAVDVSNIKKEIEDTPPESPEHGDSHESLQGQHENSNQKMSKVWSDEEIRRLIGFAKTYIPKCKDASYTKQQLLDDISKELQLNGYDTTSENVRYKLKYLRTKWRSMLQYNARHAKKRSIPFEEELAGLYSLDYFDDNDYLPCNGNAAAHEPSTSTPLAKRIPKPVDKLIASHVDLRTVVTTKKKPSDKAGKPVARKKFSGKRGSPLFQCGLCLGKFKTSGDMHEHSCKAVNKVNDFANLNGTKKKSPAPAQSSNSFHWNQLVTIHFLEYLKEYQDSHKNSNFRKGNIWVNMNALMKQRGHVIPPKDLERKWRGLSIAFLKTISYNSTHKDKRKCSFFKRLKEMYHHPSSFDCFRNKSNSKMTVEVSPFSFTQQPMLPKVHTPASSRRTTEDIKPEIRGQQNGLGELLRWLDSSFSEYKEMERKREEREAARHMELMEMLSYLIESSGNSAG